MKIYYKTKDAAITRAKIRANKTKTNQFVFLDTFGFVIELDYPKSGIPFYPIEPQVNILDLFK